MDICLPRNNHGIKVHAAYSIIQAKLVLHDRLTNSIHNAVQPTMPVQYTFFSNKNSKYSYLNAHHTCERICYYTNV